MPDEAEAHALLALMLINHARNTARFRGGELVLLDDQDRSLWNRQLIEEGRDLLERALALHGSGPYLIQAAIADLHLRQPRNWEQIALLYERLEQITSSPVVTMNRAIAIAELQGPRAGLALLDRLDLDDYRYYHSTRADLLRRLGRHDEARAAYTRALEQSQPRARATVPREPPRRPPQRRRPLSQAITRRYGPTASAPDADSSARVSSACSGSGTIRGRRLTQRSSGPARAPVTKVTTISGFAARFRRCERGSSAVGW